MTISNAYYMLSPPNPGELGDAVIRGVVSQVTEFQPSIAKLHRLRGLLRGCEYDGEDIDDQVSERCNNNIQVVYLVYTRTERGGSLMKLNLNYKQVMQRLRQGCVIGIF